MNEMLLNIMKCNIFRFKKTYCFYFNQYWRGIIRNSHILMIVELTLQYQKKCKLTMYYIYNPHYTVLQNSPTLAVTDGFVLFPESLIRK